MINTKLTKEEVWASWSKGGGETDESTKMFILKDDENLQREVKTPSTWDNLSDNGKLSILTYIHFRDSEKTEK